MIAGVLAVSMIVLPYFLLGEGSYVQVHDQIDGEILNYIYRAKYLFRGEVIPEFMNGMSKAAMVPPAPLGVIFYALLPPFWAFVAMQWMVVLAGFLGMRGLCKYLGCREEVASLTAILFAAIPFYPTYGLTALGQPLLILCYLRMLKGEKRLLSLLGIVFFAGFSSLTLNGFVWVALGAALAVGLFVRREGRKPALRGCVAWAALVATYLLTNLELLGSLLGEHFITHRREMVLRPTERMGAKIWELLFRGGAYHPVYSAGILALTIGTLLCVAVWRRHGRTDAGIKSLLMGILGILGAILGCVLLAALWNSSAIVKLRMTMGGIVTYFQADRISWVLPTLWMLMFACVGELLYRIHGANQAPAQHIVRVGLCGLWGMVFLLEGAFVFRDSTFNKNIRLLLLPDYQQVTWESIYMEDVFREIDEEIGADKERVSVVSLGIYPSVALYNGYTCADGYSNNYKLEYKHTFRRIMAKELEKQEEVRSYFDDWGNRLYLVSAEYGFNGMIPKGQGVRFAALSYNIDAMREMNIGYLFAAAPIVNAEDMGIFPVREEAFSSESSYYEVWVYRIP